MSAPRPALRRDIIFLIKAARFPVQLDALRLLCKDDPLSVDVVLDQMTIEDSLVRTRIGDRVFYEINPEKPFEQLETAENGFCPPAQTDASPAPVAPPAPEPVPEIMPARPARKKQISHERSQRIGAEIVDLLKQHGGLQSRTIFENLGVSQNTFSVHMRRLEADGLVIRVGDKARPTYQLASSNKPSQDDAQAETPAAPVNATYSVDRTASTLALEQKVLDDTLKFHQERAEIEAKRRGQNPMIEPESTAIAVDAQTAVFALRSDLKLEIDTGDVSIVLSPECTVALATYLDHTCSLVLPARAPMTEKH